MQKKNNKQTFHYNSSHILSENIWPFQPIGIYTIVYRIYARLCTKCSQNGVYKMKNSYTKKIVHKIENSCRNFFPYRNVW